MPKRTSYAQGTPNWVDLQTTDTAGAKAFYGQLFGWVYDDQPMPQGGAYSMALLGGESVAAIAPQSPELAAASAPPMWNTYLAVDSVDDTAARVEAAGGQVAMAPFDVVDAGRMAFIIDPSGAAVALWQASQHIGATLVNEPGTVTWNELSPPTRRWPGSTSSCSVSPPPPWTWGSGRTRCSRWTASRWAARSRRSSRARRVTGMCTSRWMTRTPPRPGSPSWAARCWPGRSTPRWAGSAVAQDPQGAVFSIIKPTPPPA